MLTQSLTPANEGDAYFNGASWFPSGSRITMGNPFETGFFRYRWTLPSMQCEVQEAKLVFIPDDDYAVDTCNLEFFLLDIDDCPSLSSDQSALGTAGSLVEGTVPAWVDGVAWTSPSLKALIDLWLARSGVAWNSHIGIKVANSFSSPGAIRACHSSESAGQTGPQLVVSYIVPEMVEGKTQIFEKVEEPVTVVQRDEHDVQVSEKVSSDVQL